MRGDRYAASCSPPRNHHCNIEFSILNMRIESELYATLIIDYGSDCIRLHQGNPIKIFAPDLSDCTYRVLDQNSLDIDSGRISLTKKLLFFSDDQITNESYFNFVFRLNGRKSNITLKIKFQLSGPKRYEYAQLRKQIRGQILSTKSEPIYRNYSGNTNIKVREFTNPNPFYSNTHRNSHLVQNFGQERKSTIQENPIRNRFESQEIRGGFPANTVKHEGINHEWYQREERMPERNGNVWDKNLIGFRDDSKMDQIMDKRIYIVLVLLISLVFLLFIR